MRIYLIIGGAVVLLIGLGLLAQKPIEEKLGMETYEHLKVASDVIGTQTVTTTAPVGIGVASGSTRPSATTTYISKLGENVSTAIYNLLAVQASSTAFLTFEVQGSNDYYCDTTATSTTDTSLGGDYPLISEIAWFSASDHLKGKVHATSFTSSSSTQPIRWDTPKDGEGQEIILTDLNYECLKLEVSGASTTLYANLRTK